MPQTKHLRHLKPVNLEGGLILRTAVTDDQVRSTVNLLGRIFGPTAGDLIRAMIDGYPGYRREGVYIVEDPSRDAEHRVVSTLALTDRPWVFGGVVVPVAILEAVATDPDYRERGLSATLYRVFETEARRAGYTVSSVSGIPRFYEKLGYTYAIPSGPSISFATGELAKTLESSRLKRVGDPGTGPGYSVREVALADVPDILDLYERRTQSLDIYGLWTREAIEHQVRELTPVSRRSRYVVERLGVGEPAVKASFSFLSSDGMASVADLVASEYEAVLEALRWAAEEAARHDRHRIWVDVPPGTPEHDVARMLGPREERQYGWQVRFLDRAGFLSLIRPVLERRLADSLYHGLTHDLSIDLYESCLTLKWEEGQLVEAREDPGLTVAGRSQTKMPEHALVKSVFGYRNLERLMDEYPDVSVPRFLRPLLDVLFPQLKAMVDIPIG